MQFKNCCDFFLSYHVIDTKFAPLFISGYLLTNLLVIRCEFSQPNQILSIWKKLKTLIEILKYKSVKIGSLNLKLERKPIQREVTYQSIMHIIHYYYQYPKREVACILYKIIAPAPKTKRRERVTYTRLAVWIRKPSRTKN